MSQHANHTNMNESDAHEFYDVNNGCILVPESDREITQGEVLNAIQQLKPGKAAGIGDIPAEFFKVADNIISPFLTKFFNCLFDRGVFPEDWTKAVIVPLFKKGDPNIVDNYRGISLLCIMSKIFTSILNSRLYTWAEYEKKICEEQAGFRKGYSTIDHLFTYFSIRYAKRRDCSLIFSCLTYSFC
jgi:hypothetical protein